LLVILMGCDKVDPPYIEASTGGGDTITGDTAVKKILLEEFTGHTCGNCPEAAVTVQQLHDLYGVQLIVISAHVSSFADTQNNPDSSYAYDFKTTMGNALEAQFGASALPTGMVNRIDVSGNPLHSHNAWGTTIDTIIGQAPEIDIDITTTYNSVTRTVSCDIETNFLTAMNGSYNLVVCLIEDSITNWQKIYPGSPVPGYPTGDIENYLHRHVLRTAINSTWGDQIATGTVPVGTSTSNNYNQTLHSTWVEDQCHVIAYVYDAATYKIIQAEETAVK